MKKKKKERPIVKRCISKDHFDPVFSSINEAIHFAELALHDIGLICLKKFPTRREARKEALAHAKIFIDKFFYPNG
jgi:hypothetical protein